MNQYIISLNRWGLEEIDYRSQIIIDSILALFPYDKNYKTIDDTDRNIKITLHGEIIATGYLEINNAVRVFANSQINLDVAAYTLGAQTKREELFVSEIIVEEEGKYILLEEQIFSSVSTAAEFILGGSKNGWDVWKGYNDLPIKDLFKN